MKKSIHTIMCTVLLVLLVAAVPLQASAEGGAELYLPIKTYVEGGVPQVPDEFTVEFKAVTEGAPMPEGSVDGVCTLKFRGNDSRELAIAYPRLGIYNYTVSQIPGNAQKCTYDKRVYNLEVSVINAPEGDNIIINVAIQLEGQEEKCTELSFTNQYDWPADHKPKTGDESELALFLCMSLLSAVAAAIIGAQLIKKHK